MNIQTIGLNTLGNASPSPERVRPPQHATQAEVKLPDNANDKEAQNAPSESLAPNDLDKLTQTVNDFVQKFNNNLQFNVDQDTGRTVVKVVDTTTQEVIKQIPSEEMLALAKALDQLKGVLVTQKA